MNILYALQVLVGFGFVIFIHEMGHFLAAKKVGITCSAFSIGFPFPFKIKGEWRAFNIFKYTWRGTEYRLGWIPFGGYVQMQGQADSPSQLSEAQKDDPGDYRNKTYWQKTLVLLGGVTMNAITAVIGFILAFQFGVTFIEPTVGLVSPNSKAWMENEIQVGDRILEVNGRVVDDFEDVIYAPIFDGGDYIDVKIERDVDGGVITKDIRIALTEDPRFGIKLPSINAKHRVLLSADEAERFPESLGDDRPQEGDELFAINGVKPRNFPEATGRIEMQRGEIELTLRRGIGEGAREWTTRYTPRRHYYSGSSAYSAGISFMPTMFVNAVRRHDAAAEAGIRKGDHLIGIRTSAGEERLFKSFGDLTSTIDASGGKPITLIVTREKKRIDVACTPRERATHPGRYALGVSVSTFDQRGLSEAEIAAQGVIAAGVVKAWSVRSGGVADRAGIRAGDVIVGVKVAGREFVSEDGGFGMAELAAALFAAGAEEGKVLELVFEVQRDNELKSIVVKPDLNGADSVAYLILAPGELRTPPKTYPIGESISRGFYHSTRVGYKIMMTLKGLFTSRISITHLGGPLVIAKLSYNRAQWGIGTLIFFLAFISINLAVINLFPLPVLDGGQWLIVTIEAILRKPLPERALGVVTYISFFAVIGLMLFVLGNDIITIWWRGWI